MLTREDYEDARAKAMLHKGGYAHMVYKNHLIDTLRTRKQQTELKEHHAISDGSEFRAAELLAVLDALPVRHREPILCYAKHLNARLCAEEMGVTVAAFKCRLSRARKAVLALLSRDEAV